jgi:glutaredoxin
MSRLVLIVLVLVSAYFGWKHFMAPKSEFESGASVGMERMQALAASVKADEVVMYSTTECPYCREAKGWLDRHGFAFTECNMSVDTRCEQEFKAYGANGTPFLVITRGGKTHQMRDGFDSDEFLAAVES